jgi:7,8-dihydropterin-6-yl-methyl-4-(beta-D-ribofuranosyl)aminobenzene 5'-phosphate synthase
MAALEISPDSVDLIFLSHPHWDHVGARDSALEVIPEATVVVHEGFSKHLINNLSALCKALIVVGTEPEPVAAGVYSNGMADSTPPEQAVILDTGGITAVVSGCAHPGIGQIVAHASHFLGKRIDWAIVGSHLLDAAPARTAASVSALQDLGIRYLVPTHCSGVAGTTAFRGAFGTNCFDGGVGRVFELTSASADPVPHKTG